ncbi:MAG TPA: DUF2905 domain-containing protein [Anaerolineales bacterium]|nr:DUF2905 domain-containing protein [Anaerolineales bacterium]
MISLARILVMLGLILLIAGGLLYLAGRWQLPLGRLPGDIRIERENFTCFFPVATMILLSVALTIVLNLILRLLNR